MDIQAMDNRCVPSRVRQHANSSFTPSAAFWLLTPGVGRVALLVGLLVTVLGSRSAIGQVQFNQQIRPLLAENCLSCHGPDASRREADLRLDDEQAAKQAAITPHKPDESEFFARISTSDSDELMPPPDSGKSLTAAEIELFRTWIAEGAEYQGHWSFEPIEFPELPSPTTSARTEIDRLILAGLEKHQLAYSARVSRAQLLRRASFDLTGLPPSWEEVQAFVADPDEGAFEKALDRLLESPRYGERWGRYWLDLARYADTHGGSAIGFTQFPFSYTYRDYVIQAFNADLPYDRFIQEQLAADQLGLADNDPALAGLGFLTVGMQYRSRHDVIDDQIDVVTRGLLGLTVACARCHDHKYDAIATSDYYSLYATLAASRPPDVLPLVGEPTDSEPYRDYQRELASRQIVVDDHARDQGEVMRSRLRMQVGQYLGELAKGVTEQDLSAVFLSYRTDDLRPAVLNRWRKYLLELTVDDPVFGPWKRMSELAADGFGQNSAALIESFDKENGDPASFANQTSLASVAPKWNPRVLSALRDRNPQSLLEVAEAYGKLFAEVHEEWLRAVLEATLEASVNGTIVPDEDVKHTAVNSAINQQLRRHLYGPGTPTAMSDEDASHLLNRPVRDNLSGKQGAIHALNLSSPGSPPRAMALREDEQAGQFYVFKRGNPIDRGDPVEPQFFGALSPPTSAPFPAGQRRLALANAIVAGDNPLTRRVIVNWVWQHHFGVGLVRTPDDFGTRGKPPTHPQLLDYLAETFAQDGWSLKKLHKRIMLSDAYQQGSIENEQARQTDPDNELLWRFPRQRLNLEAMRDAMLMVSGELEPTLGGRPFHFLTEPVVPRRSVYGFVNRDIISSLASTFDGANPNACTVKRSETSVPQQTLFALNSSFIQDRAARFAQNARQAVPEDDAERARWMYQRAFSRDPEEQELTLALQYVRSAADPSEGANDAAGPWQQLAHVLLAANEFVFVD